MKTINSIKKQFDDIENQIDGLMINEKNKSNNAPMQALKLKKLAIL